MPQLSSREKRRLLRKFNQAPETVQEKIKLFLDKPSEETWYQWSTAMIKAHMKSDEHQFNDEENSGMVAVGFVNQSYGKGGHTEAKLKLGDEEITVFTMPQFASKKEWKDFLHVDPNNISIYIDVPLSLLWADLTYDQAIDFMQRIASFFNDEYSIEKNLARRLAPITDGVKVKVKEMIKEAEKAIEEAQNLIREKARVVRDKVFQLKSMEGQRQALDLAKRLKRLMLTNVFTNMTVDDTGLHVTIKDIMIKDHGFEYPLGDFRINLDLSNGDSSVELVKEPNYTERQKKSLLGDTTIHPHIRDGHPCLGNYTRTMTDIVMSQEIDLALVQYRQYLQSWNPDDAYLPITEWLPDRFYSQVAHEGEDPKETYARAIQERPWENEDPKAGPGNDPTPDAYHACFERSEKMVKSEEQKLRCLDMPFGDTCKACPHAQSRDDLFKGCAAQADHKLCMACGDFNCPNLPLAEDQCLRVAKSEARENKKQLSCLECPFNRKAECRHGEVAFTNCWTVQEPIPVADRACATCEWTSCQYHPSSKKEPEHA